MANAKKLPSGAWRTNASKTINGKKYYKSFTVSPKECGGDSRKVGTPYVQDVQMLIDNAKGIMLPIIHLAAFETLRRGEIGGLREMDISRDMRTITVNGDMVLGPDKKWVYKPFPKTSGSVRTVVLPPFVMDSLPVKDNPKDFLFSDLTPTAMTDRFARLAKKLQLPYTLHMLWHYSASFRTDIGVPKKYVQETGGWIEDNTVLSRVYDNTMESERRKYQKLVVKYLEETFGPDKGKKSV